jgi:hypothetical protein
MPFAKFGKIMSISSLLQILLVLYSQVLLERIPLTLAAFINLLLLGAMTVPYIAYFAFQAAKSRKKFSRKNIRVAYLKNQY